MSRNNTPSPSLSDSSSDDSHHDYLPYAFSPVKLEWPPLKYMLLVFIISFVVYSNSLSCGFAFDDISAIRDNKDIRPSTPILQIFANDFWGTPIRKEHSHKSYRPLTVLTFRLNYLFDELNPYGYHLVNVLIHSIVCLLYYKLCFAFMPESASLIAALIFAVHPIHTEAVTGVVGRAETLSSLFFLSALLLYIKGTYNHKHASWICVTSSLIMAGVATFCKEQGITVLAVIGVYELMILQKLKLDNLKQYLSIKSFRAKRMKEHLLRVCLIITSVVILLLIRIRVMGSQLPVFTKYDNPAAVASTPTRQLTYNYLLAVNSWLLLYPMNLLCDWTMGTIPLVQSFLDVRNLATIAFYVILFSASFKCLLNFNERNRNILTMSMSLIVFPFLPASNLFFPVGFVIAERVLYLPSMGFIMLIAYGWSILFRKIDSIGNNSLSRSYKRAPRMLLHGFLVVLLISFSARTWIRNYDWTSEYTIFKAALKVCQTNAKLFNNVGHSLESQGKYKEALAYFLKASETQPDDLGAQMNVGRTYNNLEMYDLAEHYFWKAKNLLPRPKPGQQYQARIAPSHLNVFLNLANLISRNRSRLEEADSLYRQAISMRADYTQAYINRGDILIKLNRTREAQDVYEQALQIDATNPDIYYNLGVVLLEQRKPTLALSYFDQALKLNELHEQALINSAILIQELGDDRLRPIAQKRLKKLIELNKANERVYFNLGMLSMDDKEYTAAEKWFKLAVQSRPDFRSALFNLGLLLSDTNRPMEALPYLKQLLAYYPDHIKGLILLGDIYINVVKNVDEAEKCYLKIVQLDPKNIQGQHNLCVIYVEKGKLEEAEKCLLKVNAISPNQDYIDKHLRIVRNRIAQKRMLNKEKVVNDSDTKL